ncbi:vacuolar protein sorting-associated protein 33B [Ischnura elegans]|uniref:vacuolar protein sorting-associated protein 33B n=1 Tax=Ischnura elegans TaxID=197161 RepID=UPI001ED8B31A|nr:vacuolar protein sorting-associated protein 33B [Ischnura elegans]
MDFLKVVSQKKLADILDRVPGKKDLVIDPSIMKPLDRITDVKMLRAHGVEKIIKLEKSEVISSTPHVVFLVYADLITAKHVVDQVHSFRQKDTSAVHHLILVPCGLLPIYQLIEEEGLHGVIKVHIFSWEYIPIDNHILSLEIPHIFKTAFLNGDYSLLKSVAKSLWSLQLTYGKIPVVLSQGKLSKIVSGMVDSYFEDLGDPECHNSKIGYMVVMDRSIDYTSSLLTSVTYTGLLDEVFNIKCGTVELTKEVTGKSNQITYLLNSKDEIYNEIKSKHFSDVYPTLKSKAKELENKLAQFKTADLSQLKHHIKNEIRNVMSLRQSLSYHIGACESIIGSLGGKYQELQNVEENIVRGRSRRESIAYIEDCLAKQTSCYMVLRLIALLSLTESGITHDEAMSLKSQFLHTYGYKHIGTFYNLEKVGLYSTPAPNIMIPTAFGGVGDTAGKLANRMAQVVSLPKQNSFRAIAQKLKLFPDASNAHNLKDAAGMGYVFNGIYIPIICQLVHLLLKKESKTAIEELLRVIPGPTVLDERMSSENQTLARVVLVVIIGGVTYAEIAALQLLETLTNSRIIVAGTSLINGKVLVQHLTQM